MPRNRNPPRRRNRSPKTKTVKDARAFFKLDNRTEYNKIRREISNICSNLHVFNQTSERWYDAVYLIMDTISFFSKRQRYRKWFNNRDNTPEGVTFWENLKAIIVDAAGNVRTKFKTSYESEGKPQMITSCYHLDDHLPSCVRSPTLYFYRSIPDDFRTRKLRWSGAQRGSRTREQ